MKVILLGSGGYYATKQRHTACMMLPEVGVVLDAGSGMCDVGQFLEMDRLDIFLSHAHLDHITGLTCLLNVLPDRVQEASTVYAKEEKLAAVREHLFAEAIFPVPPRFRFAALDGTVNIASGGCVTWFPLEHPGASVGYRLDWPGHSLAYVTDTTARSGATYVDAIRGADLLLHEAFFDGIAEDRSGNFGHSALLDVAQVAAEAAVSRLVIVHIDPQIKDESAFDMAEARRMFKDIEIGADGMVLEF